VPPPATTLCRTISTFALFVDRLPSPRLNPYGHGTHAKHQLERYVVVACDVAQDNALLLMLCLQTCKRECERCDMLQEKSLLTQQGVRVCVCVCVLLRGALCCGMTGSSPLGVDTSSCTLSSSPSSSRSSFGAGRFDRGDVNESICLRGCSETSGAVVVCVSVCVRGGVRQQPTSVDGGIGHTCERWGR
jgi:hypothetical protein